jgi:hypothetical protein
MIISRKNFEKEVEKRVRKERRIARIEDECWQQDKLIRKMKYKIKELECRIRELEENRNKTRGMIRGFYQAEDGDCTIINDDISFSRQITLKEESTEPEG